MNARPLVSIVINNYNYARFLGRAIESALRQTYAPLQVIVVDDGSTDDSRAVIAPYADRVEVHFQPNGGQAAALNAGFDLCRGDVTFFLDADDMLHPTVVERVVDAFDRHPQAVRVQFRLDVVDAYDLPTGASKPPRETPVPGGDLRRQVLAFGDDIPWLPTSGNAFRTTMLRTIFPIPVEPYRICADYYLSNLSPLFGEVATLEDTGGYYRVHAANNHASARLDLRQTRAVIVRSRQTHRYVRDAARRLGLDIGRRDLSALAVSHWANRLVSLRLDPAQHPIAHDSPLSVTLRGVNAALRRPGLSFGFRLVAALWFLVTALAPPRLLWWMAEQFFFPEARLYWLGWLAAGRRGLRALSLRRPTWFPY